MTTEQLAARFISIERVEAVVEKLSPHAMAAAAFGTRLILGYSFFLTGRGKLRYFDDTVQFFMDLGIPFATANAGFVAALELLGGIALMLGLGTRVFAALLSSTMIVALLTADGENLVDAVLQRDSVALTDVTPLVFLVLLSWLLSWGAGRFSFDAWLANMWRERRLRA